ncbi:telomerase protein component 1-like [Actinia tenebrosa]|uniref:Telomerase protein component 1-like n=1 Tax=Actinia tenebrosa TaxID=6105 RepID=A0A6P8HBE6_ACTTE|nr:telomerase protein component 1-like [Actinia tenebrosa]
MGSNCSGLKAGGESYSLAGDKHNKVHHEPQHGHTNTPRTAVDITDAGGNHANMQTDSNLDAEELSSSRDVNLQVSQDEKPQAQHESGVGTTTMDGTMVSTPSTNAQNVVTSCNGHAKISDADFSKLSNIKEDEANDIVNECWVNIERTCDVSAEANKNVLIHATGWRVVRLFVSSTFADYHAERELLVKKVFPELREWCESRHIQLIECDLRWGVPKDSTTEMTIKTCLGEIDRCKEESNGTPFFLNMLGERYGWMPGPKNIPQDIQQQYDWVFPASITHMEILHAAYRTKNPNAAFFIRDPSFLDKIPSDMQPSFVDGFPLSKVSLKMLKKKLKERFPSQTFEYSCEYDGIDDSTGRQKVKLKGLEEFGQKVLEQFKSFIERTFPSSQQELSPEELDLLTQDNFIRSKGSLLLGRSNEIESIVEYATNGCLPGQSRESSNDTCPILLVQGVPGSGKSSLMAYCTLEAKKLDCLLFYHFVGSGPGTTDPIILTNRLYKWLKQITNTETEDEEKDKDISYELIKEKIDKVNEEVKKLDKKIVIILDALNQLSDADKSTHHLYWLPNAFPSNVCCIASVVEGSRSANILLHEDRNPRPLELHVGALDNSARKEIVQHILGAYNKKLDDQQMDLLISLDGATNPLWLSLSCEELRVFGVFERVTDHIKSFPDSLQGLLKFILKRLVSEDEFQNVEKVLRVLECMSMTETELRWIIKDGESDEPLPMMQWAVVRRTLKPFLRNTGQQGQEERLDFFHASISQVVKDTLMTDQQENVKWYLRISDYFQYVCKDNNRATEAVAVQLKNAGAKKRLLDYLRNDYRPRRMQNVWKNKFYKFLQCGQIIPKIQNLREEVSLCQMCGMQNQGLGQLAGLNKNVCVICGQHIPSFWQEPQHIALLCQRHKPMHAPGRKICFLCNRPAFQNATTGYTCMVCGVGFQKCVKMVT